MIFSMQVLSEGRKTKREVALQSYILHDLCLTAAEVAWAFCDKYESWTSQKSLFQMECKCSDLHPLPVGSMTRVELAFVYLLK